MKRILIFILAFIYASVLFGQTGLPLKTYDSPLFGQDIVIHDSSDRNQKNSKICSAPNGWLYNVYSYKHGAVQDIALSRSKDNGMNWEYLGDLQTPIVANDMKDLEITVLGDDPANHNVFISTVTEQSNNPSWAICLLDRFSAVPFSVEDWILQPEDGVIRDVSLATDFQFPSFTTNPYSLGILYCVDDVTDTLYFKYSGNGGETFTRKVIHTTDKEITKVSLAFGRSPAFPDGHYFAAWEEVETAGSRYGHIYTSHTQTYVYSPFTTPVCLDSLDINALNSSGNPVISCQYSNQDNNLSSFSELITFEQLNSSSNNSNIRCFYNLQAPNSTNFQIADIISSSNIEMNQYVVFNPYDSKFYLSYYDSTLKELPLYKADMNSPQSWELINSDYNDDNNLINASPDITIGLDDQKPGFSWIKYNEKSEAYFDSFQSNYNGITEEKMANSFKISPNPCHLTTNIVFEAKIKGKSRIKIIDLRGNSIRNYPEFEFHQGINEVSLDLQGISQGMYLIILNIEETILINKIAIL